MKTDKYTKTLLTIIAICLINLSFKGTVLFPKAYAGENNLSNPAYGLVPLNEDGSITVRLSNTEEIDVNISGIDTSDELEVEIVGIDTSDELDINIEEIGGSFIPTGGAIPVKLKK